MDLNTYLSGKRASELAKLLDVTPAVVSQWRNGVRQVPAERCPDIEQATGGAVTCEELRPDLADKWAYLRGSKPPATAYVCVCAPVSAPAAERADHFGGATEMVDEPPCGLCDPRQGDRRTPTDRRRERHNHEGAA